LLQEEEFHGSIWEPCCGDGAIVKAITIKYPNAHMMWSDIYYHGFQGTFQLDFLKSNIKVDNIITGPPYLKNEYCAGKDAFADHAYNLATKKVALLLPTTALGAEKRTKGIWTKQRRIPVGKIWYHKGTEFEIGINSCWHIWNK
jgi:hypothetical protein